MCKKKNEANLVATSEGFTHLRYAVGWSGIIEFIRGRKRKNGKKLSTKKICGKKKKETKQKT